MKTFPRYLLTIVIVAGLFLLSNADLRAQTQLAAPTGHVNDFAAVLDTATKERIETLLQNLKLRSKVDFYVATVENTGTQDIFDYSRQLAREWNLGARTSGSKSLLLVLSVSSKSSFTQFSRLVQDDLPEGVLGEMSQHMRNLLAAGRVAEAIDDGVQLFVRALSQKIGFSLDGIDKPVVVAESTNPAPTPAPTPEVTAATEPPKTRPRVVSEAAATPTEPPAETPAPTASEPAPTKNPRTANNRRNSAAKPVAVTRPKRKPATATPVVKENTPADDEAESEEVELTLTLPLPQRAVKLKEFLDAHPNSKAKPRAIELLISTHAALGDQQLKNGDSAGGIEQLMLAISEADVSISEKLFSGVISQIPLNLYLRGEHAAAFKAAQDVEAKFGSDPKRLLALAGFYLNIERGDEVTRLAQQAVKLAPDMAEAHRILAVGLHISLRLDEAAAEYKKTLELDPTAKGARAGLADLTRASGNAEEALAIYNDQLKADPKDKAATTGRVIALLELDRKDEASAALDGAIADDPRNLPLLAGAAYWFAAHENYDRAFELASKATAIEPRYTWAQIALARSLMGLKRPLDAERALRFARQYGKFPTLTYELASVLSSMGLYDEAVDILRESFAIKDGQIETQLAGRLQTRQASFSELLAPERRASIYQSKAADSAANAKTLRDLLAFNSALSHADGEKIDEAAAATTAKDFASGDDQMRAYRQLYSSTYLVRNNVALDTAADLAEQAKKNVGAAVEAVSATMAVQADEYRILRARAIASGSVPDVADAPRDVITNIFRGRAEDLIGWALFNQEKYPEALEHLKVAAATLPAGTPSSRNALWHLGVVLEQSGSDAEALENYIKSFNAGEKDPIRRAVIEKLYRKVNGSLDGLEDRIGAASISSVASPTPPANPPETAAEKPQPSPEVASTATPDKTPTPTPDTAPKNSEADKPVEPASTNKPETTPPANAEATPSPSPESTPPPAPESTPAPTPTPTPTPAPATPESPAPADTAPSDDTLRAAAARTRAAIKISGRVVDAERNAMANVVVVLISPSGSVLASTTDTAGNFSFTVMPSARTYRILPSKDGYSFTPIDRALVGLIDDQKDIEFVGTVSK